MSIGPSIGPPPPVIGITHRLDPKEGPRMIVIKPALNFVGGVSEIDLQPFFQNGALTMIQAAYFENDFTGGPGDVYISIPSTGMHVGVKNGTAGWYHFPMMPQTSDKLGISATSSIMDGTYPFRATFMNVRTKPQIVGGGGILPMFIMFHPGGID